MKSSQEKPKKKWSTPKIYKIDPNDPLIANLKKLFDQPKREPAPQKSDPQGSLAEIIRSSRSSRSQTSGSSGREKVPQSSTIRGAVS
jgi:hypothetical protein